MTADARNFRGEVWAAGGERLGEARFWAVAERSGACAPWRGWLQVTDLGRATLPRGVYRVRAVDGSDAAFEPLAPHTTRVFESDLLPIVGVGDAPWPDTTAQPPPPYRPLSADAPPRRADDRAPYNALTDILTEGARPEPLLPVLGEAGGDDGEPRC